MKAELPVLSKIEICPSCKGTGFIGAKKCSECRGKSVGINTRGLWLYWSHPIDRYHLNLLRYRRIFNKIRKLTVFVLWLTCWLWAGFYLFQKGILSQIFSGDFSAFSLVGREEKILFWFGVVLLGYLKYRFVKEKKIKDTVEQFDYREKEIAPLNISNFKEVRKLSMKQKKNIANTFSDVAMEAVARAYNVADKGGYKTLEPEHLFYALLSMNTIGNIFIRLGLSEKILQERIAPIVRTHSEGRARASEMPLPSERFWQVLFRAYEDAYEAHNQTVGVTELLVASAGSSEDIAEALYDFGVNKDKLANVVEWARIRERLYNRYQKRAEAATHRSKYGMDRAMTALATPYLNSFGEDLTARAQAGKIEFCVARNSEIEEIFRVVDGNSQNVLLVGDYGVGRKSIIEGVAEKMIVEDVPERMRDKRLVRLSISSLLSGASPSEAIDRLIRVIKEVEQAGNVVLFIHNLHELVGVATGSESGSLDVADTLAENLNSGKFLTIATTTQNEYARHISNSNLSGVFTKVDIPEMDINQAIQVVESKIAFLEYKNSVFFSYDAIERAVELSARYLHDVYLPGSALDVVNEAAAFTKAKKGVNTLVTFEEIAKIISDKTGIPVATVSADESAKLLNLENEMHKRVVGQEEAVDLVANALRRARAGVRAENRPIANFMFLGPTGVGKTELSKTIAEVYFGGEDKMIRLDMSEYQDKSGIYRLIGAPGEQGTGILTEAIRRQPFSLLLLDEIEKADKDVLNLFLQVMDDGRLTDSSGRVTDFTNVILIATSNARTDYVASELRAGTALDIIKDKLLHGELANYFRPEFLNRFDGIVLFKPLDILAVREIARLLFSRVVREMDEKGIELVINDEGINYLAEAGFDPEFGARPLRRVIQEKIENRLAELLLSGRVKRRDKIQVGEGGEFKIIEKI